MLTELEPMSETSTKELDNMDPVNEDAATGTAAITKGAKPGEKIDTSGANDTIIGGSDSKGNPEGTANLGKAASAPVGVEKDKSIKTKPSGAGTGNVSAGLSGKIFDSEEHNGEETISEKEETSETKYDFSQDVDALVAGEELNEEFREKAKTLFEAVVTQRVNEETKTLQEAYESALTEEVEKIKTELAEKVDDYISYAAKQWLEENNLAVEHGIKTEMAESFFDGLKKLFIEQNFTVPEEKYNLLDGMAEELNDMETKLNEQIDSNVSLNKRIGEFVKMEIVNECATGLAETQKEKLVSLAEGVEFETEADFRKKVETIKESYFTRKAEVVAEAKTDPTEEATAPLVEETTTGTMSKYVDTLSRWSK
tara:strand:+ start:7460 stop:8566 length:1107 start_codon:yes stop_codon:yes gene_type:complete